MTTLVPELFSPILLYAETHYKFKGLYSRLFKKEPEIIADAPRRIGPGHPIPILLLAKDGHRFPVQLVSVLILITTTAGEFFSRTDVFNETIAEQKFWHKILYFQLPEKISGYVFVDVHIKIKINGKTKVYVNDNYRISSHQPLEIFLASDPLPHFENWYFGDFHYHSNYTEDQVEFGAPLAATAQLAQASGLNFFAVTDHSYDLDDREDSFILNDPEIGKWFKLKEEVTRLNAMLQNFVILPGEEVSAGNKKNQNVHLLVINNQRFFPGKGDAAERWLRTRPDLSIGEILDELEEQALAIAGHPEIKIPFLQWLLIRRGRWQWSDYWHPRLEGFQIWNGEYDELLKSGTSRWIQLLLAGKKLSLFAGNDAHGNFNRFRQIGFPFFTMRETIDQIFGNLRTGVFLSDKLNLKNLIAEIKNKHVLISSGPVADLVLQNETGAVAKIGDTIQGKLFKLIIRAKSTSEFGKLTLVKVLLGNEERKQEFEYLGIVSFENPYYLEIQIAVTDLPKRVYFRIEIHTQQEQGKIAKCLTNPIWIEIS